MFERCSAVGLRPSALHRTDQYEADGLMQPISKDCAESSVLMNSFSRPGVEPHKVELADDVPSRLVEQDSGGSVRPKEQEP